MHYHALTDVIDSPELSSYSSLLPGSPEYRRILLQATCLKSTVFRYNESSPSYLPSIYISSKPDELPIIIDTGASQSISPIPTDFDGPIVAPDVSSLNQVNGTAAIAGFGTVAWHVEDYEGTQRCIRTKACYVPEASV